MSRPVIVVQQRHWFFQHVLESEMVRLRDEMCVASTTMDKDAQVPRTPLADLRVCETLWPQEVCTCRAYTLEWEGRRPPN